MSFTMIGELRGKDVEVFALRIRGLSTSVHCSGRMLQLFASKRTGGFILREERRVGGIEDELVESFGALSELLITLESLGLPSMLDNLQRLFGCCPTTFVGGGGCKVFA